MQAAFISEVLLGCGISSQGAGTLCCSQHHRNPEVSDNSAVSTWAEQGRHPDRDHRAAWFTAQSLWTARIYFPFRGPWAWVSKWEPYFELFVAAEIQLLSPSETQCCKGVKKGSCLKFRVLCVPDWLFWCYPCAPCRLWLSRGGPTVLSHWEWLLLLPATPSAHFMWDVSPPSE